MDPPPSKFKLYYPPNQSKISDVFLSNIKIVLKKSGKRWIFHLLLPGKRVIAIGDHHPTPNPHPRFSSPIPDPPPPRYLTMVSFDKIY